MREVLTSEIDSNGESKSELRWRFGQTAGHRGWSDATFSLRKRGVVIGGELKWRIEYGSIHCGPTYNIDIAGYRR